MTETKKKIHITTSEGEILIYVEANPKCTVSQIQAGTGKGLSTVCRLVRSLDNKELIERKLFNDGRKIDARSTTIEVKKHVKKPE